MHWNAVLIGIQRPPDEETPVRAVERKGSGVARGFEIPVASSPI
jgi:hypothetical protein